MYATLYHTAPHQPHAALIERSSHEMRYTYAMRETTLPITMNVEKTPRNCSSGLRPPGPPVTPNVRYGHGADNHLDIIVSFVIMAGPLHTKRAPGAQPR